MDTKVKDQSVEEFKALISTTLRVAAENTMEDMLALSSKEYILSIREARKDCKEGNAKRLEDVFNV